MAMLPDLQQNTATFTQSKALPFFSFPFSSPQPGYLPPSFSPSILEKKYGHLLLHLEHTSTLMVFSAGKAREMIRNHDVCFSNRPKTKAETNTVLIRRKKKEKKEGPVLCARQLKR
ncbi:hypothetical protein NC653_036968 [Populus alba x Populus x berolinensis]|uniref:Uncharacterized protein n=1 Tax=Populus alba x Populus x berolinensis TaxID=444605 RepID=A0AAD6LL33_9ROSI|nr:hypothetical protein NC653_036968 [Populus alba x Populus x berolinensis]